MFEVLVEQGKGLAERARGAADQALKDVRDNAGGAGGHLEKLEQALEERVSRSLGRLGVLTRGEVGELSRQVRDLAEDVRELMAINAATARKSPRAGSSKPRASTKARAAGRHMKRSAPSMKRGAAPGARRKSKAKAKRPGAR